MNKRITIFTLLTSISLPLIGMETTITSPELLLKYPPKSWEPYIVSKEKTQKILYMLGDNNKLNLRDQNGDTIFLALIEHALDYATYDPSWLQKNGLLNDCNKYNETAIMLLCKQRKDYSTLLVKYLNCGAKTDLQDITGETALIKTIKAKNALHTTALLNIASATDILIQNHKGKTAFDYAVDTNDKTLIKRLVNSILNIPGQVPLEYCIKNDKNDIIEFIIEQGVVPTQQEIQYAKDSMNPLLADYLTNIASYYQYYLKPTSPEFSNFLKLSTFKKSLLWIALKLHHISTLNTLMCHEKDLLTTLDSSLRETVFRDAVLNNTTAILDYCIQQGGKKYEHILEMCLQENSSFALEYALKNIVIYPTKPLQLQAYDQHFNEHWNQNSKLDLYCNPYLYLLIKYTQPQKTETEKTLQESYDKELKKYDKLIDVCKDFRKRACRNKSYIVVRAYDEFMVKHEYNKKALNSYPAEEEIITTQTYEKLSKDVQ